MKGTGGTMPREYQEAVNEVRDYIRCYVHDPKAAAHLQFCMDRIQTAVDSVNEHIQINESYYASTFNQSQLGGYKHGKTRKHR
jgi:hypothetical protein